jgi:hypothetical protein
LLTPLKLLLPPNNRFRSHLNGRHGDMPPVFVSIPAHFVDEKRDLGFLPAFE